MQKEYCEKCKKVVYLMEKVSVNNQIFHDTCFKCKTCKKKLTISNYHVLEHDIYCKNHYDRATKLALENALEKERKPSVKKNQTPYIDSIKTKVPQTVTTEKKFEKKISEKNFTQETLENPKVLKENGSLKKVETKVSKEDDESKLNFVKNEENKIEEKKEIKEESKSEVVSPKPNLKVKFTENKPKVESPKQPIIKKEENEIDITTTETSPVTLKPTQRQTDIPSPIETKKPLQKNELKTTATTPATSPSTWQFVKEKTQKISNLLPTRKSNETTVAHKAHFETHFENEEMGFMPEVDIDEYTKDEIEEMNDPDDPTVQNPMSVIGLVGNRSKNAKLQKEIEKTKKEQIHEATFSRAFDEDELNYQPKDESVEEDLYTPWFSGQEIIDGQELI
eukprot:gene12620-6524_t